MLPLTEEFFINLLFLLVLASHFLYTSWKLKKDLHILQLNSYRGERYLRWMNKNRISAFKPRDLIPLLALIPFFFYAKVTAIILFIGIYLLAFVLRDKEKAKKPLIFTARAKRLYIFSLILLLVVYAIIYSWFWQNEPLHLANSLFTLILITFFSPLFLLLSNYLILPLENRIIQYYFNDAKKQIQALTNLKVIGITGSFGKTTTKYVLDEILRQKFCTLMTPASFNTPMGIAKVIRSKLQPIHEIFITELSAKQKGDILELCTLVKPKFGVLTAIGEQHLETFGSLENIKKTKNELIDCLPDDGVAFFNADDEHCRELAKLTNKKSIFYGIDAESLDYRAKDIQIDGNGSIFSVVKKNNESEIFQTKLLGKHNIYNILAAIAVAGEFGMQLNEMVYPIRKLQAVPHRLELKKTFGNVTLIDDSFNANPIGSKMALDVLQKIFGKRKIIVTPGLVELGAQEYKYNKEFGEKIAAVCDYVILVGKKQTLAIQEGLAEKKFPENALFIAHDFAEANRHLQKITQAEDVVLFENDLPDDYRE